MTDEYTYFFGRNRIDYNWIAVTAACLMVGADKFAKVSGFDEELAVAYNDVDLCFKLYEAGYYNIVRNDVILRHYESVSRGDDRADAEKWSALTTNEAVSIPDIRQLAAVIRCITLISTSTLMISL